MVERNRNDGNNRDDGAREPVRVRLPGFVADDDIGLGDVIKRATASFGIRPCGGCQRRAEILNRRIVFTGNRE